MAVAMKAIKRFRYARVQYEPGDIFKCRDKDIKLVVAAQFGVEVDPQKVVPTYQTRHMEAAKTGEMTVPELRAALNAKGVFIPSGYIPKAELKKILAEQ